MHQRGNIALISLIIILLLAAAAAFFFISKGKGSSPNSSLGSQIFQKTQNPLEDKIPQTNPFTKINPFKGVYQNPFE